MKKILILGVNGFPTSNKGPQPLVYPQHQFPNESGVYA